MKIIILIISLLILARANDVLPIVSNTIVNDWHDCPFLMYSYGFLTTSGLMTQIPDLQYCVANATNLKANIEAAIAQFQQRTVTTIGKGVIILGKTFGDLIDECGNTFVESRNLLSQLKQDLKSETFILAGLQRLADNIGVVLQDIDNSKFDMDNGDYFLSGSDAGNVASIFFQFQTPIEEDNDKTPYPFADCFEGEELIRMKHIYVEQTERNTWRFGLEGTILRTFSLDYVKIEDKFSNNKSQIYALDGKQYRVGENFYQVLEEIGGFDNVIENY